MPSQQPNSPTTVVQEATEIEGTESEGVGQE
jgi:hypothetical protein